MSSDVTQIPLGSEMLLRASRGRAWLLMPVSAAFTATGVWMIRAHQVSGWLVAGFFGLCSLAGLAGVLLPQIVSLRLTSEGFTIRSLVRSSFIDWADVVEFGVTSVGMNRMVGFNFAPGYRRGAAIRGLSRTIAGFEGALPNTYGMKAVRLAALMSAYRAHALSSRRSRQL